jgi:osmotically inducible protein OsmC
MKKSSTAIWKGPGKTGKGILNSQSGVLSKVPYSYHSRFEEGNETNPEELIAAAHAGCFSMKLSFLLGEQGFTPDWIETMATVILQNGAITGSHLNVRAKVPGMTKEEFNKCAQESKTKCPVSKALNLTITMKCELQEEEEVVKAAEKKDS